MHIFRLAEEIYIVFDWFAQELEMLADSFNVLISQHLVMQGKGVKIDLGMKLVQLMIVTVAIDYILDIFSGFCNVLSFILYPFKGIGGQLRADF